MPCLFSCGIERGRMIFYFFSFFLFSPWKNQNPGERRPRVTQNEGGGGYI